MAEIDEMKAEFSNLHNFDLRKVLENLIMTREHVQKNENSILKDMVDIRDLHFERKKAEKLGIEFSRDKMASLVSKLNNVKYMRKQIATEKAEITKEFRNLHNNKSAIISNSKSMMLPAPNSHIQGSSFANGHSGSNILSSSHPIHFIPDASQAGNLLGINSEVYNQNNQSIYDSQSGRVNLDLMSDPNNFRRYLHDYEKDLNTQLIRIKPGTFEFRTKMEELAKISDMRHSLTGQDPSPSPLPIPNSHPQPTKATHAPKTN
jgi:hypothetical protein